MKKHFYFIVILALLIACKSNSKKAKIYLKQGISKAYSSDFEEAIKDFDKAIYLQPDFADAYFYRGNSNYNLNGNIKKAIEDYNKAIEIKPDFANAYNNRGNMKSYLGNEKGACYDWIKADKLGRENMRDKIKKCSYYIKGASINSFLSRNKDNE